MAGVKGRSGRRPQSFEKRRLATIDKAWQIVDEFLNKPEIDLNYKLQYAIDVVKKSIPQGPIIDQSQHTHFTFEYKKLDENRIRIAQRSDGGLGVGGEVESFGSRPTVREDITRNSRVDEESTIKTEG